MPRTRYSLEEIIHKLREAEVLLSQGHTTQEASRQTGHDPYVRLLMFV